MLRIDNVTLRRHGYRKVKLLSAAACGAWALAFAASLLHGGLPFHDGSLTQAGEALTMSSATLWLLGMPLAVAALVAFVFARTAPRRSGAVEVGEQGLRMEGHGRAAVVPHERVSAGWYAPAQQEVVLTLEGGDVLRVGVLERAHAEPLIDALAAGATERALDLALQREALLGRAFSAALLLLFFFPALLGLAALESIPLLVAASAAFAVGWYLFLTRFGAPERVVAGHDGISLEAPHGARFLPFARIDEVAPSVDGVVLTLDDLSRVPVRLFRPRAGRALELGLRRRDHLLVRLRAELAAWRDRSADPLGAALLDRRGRPLAAWRVSLRELTAGTSAGAYRAASIDADHLVRILETRAAPAERRLGAALALSESGDPALQRRVRIFIDTCAGDDLRDAIEEAASGELDDARLHRALSRMSRP